MRTIIVTINPNGISATELKQMGISGKKPRQFVINVKRSNPQLILQKQFPLRYKRVYITQGTYEAKILTNGKIRIL